MAKALSYFHDFQHATGDGAMDLLNDLKAGGYKVVFMKPKEQVRTLPKYDAFIANDVAAKWPSGPNTSTAASNSQPTTAAPANVQVARPQNSPVTTQPSDQNRAGRRVALVIGNSSYQYAGELANPKNDAADVTAALRMRGFQVIDGINLDKAGLERKIRDFSRALRGAEVGVFFYAGHGLQFWDRITLSPSMLS